MWIKCCVYLGRLCEKNHSRFRKITNHFWIKEENLFLKLQENSDMEPPQGSCSVFLGLITGNFPTFKIVLYIRWNKKNSKFFYLHLNEGSFNIICKKKYWSTFKNVERKQDRIRKFYQNFIFIRYRKIYF